MSFNPKAFKESIGLNALHRAMGHKHGERHQAAKSAALKKKYKVSPKMVNRDEDGRPVKDADRNRDD